MSDRILFSWWRYTGSSKNAEGDHGQEVWPRMVSERPHRPGGDVLVLADIAYSHQRAGGRAGGQIFKRARAYRPMSPPPRHVVVGEGFGFEMTHESKHLMYMFFGGNLAILVWKCS